MEKNKNYIDAINCLEQLPSNYRLYEIEILWVLTGLTRNHGHRINTSKQLGIAVRTLTKYIQDMRELGIEVPRADPFYRDKNRRKNEIRDGLDNPKRRDGPT